MFRKTFIAAIAASVLGAGAVSVSTPAEATLWNKDRYESRHAGTYHKEHKLLWWKNKDRKHGWHMKNKHKKHYSEPAPKYRPMK